MDPVFRDDPDVAWEGFDLIVPGSCWHPFLRPAEVIGRLVGLEGREHQESVRLG